MNHSMSLHMYKAIYVVTIFIWALSLSRGSEYEYMYDNNETCIDVKMNVLFSLSNGNETVTFDGNNFTVKSGDCANEGEFQAVLTLENSNEDLLTVTFNTQPNLIVNMSLMFTFAPFEFFPGTPIDATISLLDIGDLQLGINAQLYKCEAPQTMTLTGELEGTTYTMYMDMSNVQIQAFDIKDGHLSTDVFVCSADQMTTVAQQTSEANNSSQGPTQPTTEPSASTGPTVEPSNGTTGQTTVGPSEDPITVPTSMTPTTTPAVPFPPISAYEVMENSTACLIMEGSFQLEVTYQTKDNKTAKMTVNVPESSNVEVTGTCASANETSSSLTITPKDAEIKSMTFNFEVTGDTSYLVFWSADVDLTKFPDAKEPELKHTVNDTQEKLSNPKFYYKCDVEGTFSDDTLAFSFRNLRVQAFNVEDGKFSENGEDCKADVDPIPAPGSPPVNTFSVLNGNNTCIVFKGSIQFNIPYVSKYGNTTELVSLPAKTNVSGQCNTTLNGLYSQQLVIGFYDTWELTIYFSSNKEQEKDLLTAEEGVSNYHISQIELKYDYNNGLFTEADDSIIGKIETVTVTNQTFLSTDVSKSFMCNNGAIFNLPKGLSMVTKDLQFQAFKEGNTTDFDGASECAGAAVNCEDGENYLLLISTGAALGGLLLIVLVVVIVNKKCQSYDKLTF